MPIDLIIARTVFARQNGTTLLWLNGNGNRTRTRQHSCNIRRLYGNVSVVSRQTPTTPTPPKRIHLSNRRICTDAVFRRQCSTSFFGLLHSLAERGTRQFEFIPVEDNGDGIVPVSPAKEQSRPVPLYTSAWVLARAPLCAQGVAPKTPPALRIDSSCTGGFRARLLCLCSGKKYGKLLARGENCDE